MAKKQEITVEMLIPVGAEKLAEILLDISSNDKNVAKRLERLVSLRSGSDKTYISSVQKQLSLLFRKGRYYDYYTTKNLADSLNSIRNDIVNDLLATNPTLAAQLLKDLFKRVDQAFECADDSNGEIGNVFAHITDSLGKAWCAVPNLDARVLANEIFELMESDGYDFTDNLVHNTRDVLGEEGLKIIEDRARQGLAGLPPVPASPPTPKQKIILGKNADPSILPLLLGKDLGSLELYDADGYRCVFGNSADRSRFVNILKIVADVSDNVDLYIESCNMSENPHWYVEEIAERLLKHHRPQEALEWLNSGNKDAFFKEKKENLKITTLTVLGKHEEAQQERWNAFCASMNQWFYIDYVDHAEKTEHEAIRAKAIVAANDADFFHAIRFLTWLQDAKALKHYLSDKPLDGKDTSGLTAAADFLADEEPAFAAKIYYLLINAVLDKGASKYYSEAVHNLLKVRNCAKHMESSVHENFLAALKEKHGKKRTFWQMLTAMEGDTVHSC